MTLISSHIHPAFAIQISDRLVVEKSASGIRPFNPHSNKSVVFGALDAVVSISYTGLAFVGDMMMDEWIAATLIGHFPNSGLVRMGNKVLASWFDIGRAANKLLFGLRNGGVGQSGEPFEMVIVGWQWKRRGRHLRFVRPILWVLRPPFTNVSRKPRWALLKLGVDSYVTPGANADKQKFLAIRQEDDRRYKFDPLTMVNQAEHSFVRATRESANRTFGEDFMSIASRRLQLRELCESPSFPKKPTGSTARQQPTLPG
jgi:hypothetical protein